MMDYETGRVDRLGYAYCRHCAEYLGIVGEPVMSWNGWASQVACDRCGRTFASVPAPDAPAESIR
jgi:hypothetical protein